MFERGTPSVTVCKDVEKGAATVPLPVRVPSLVLLPLELLGEVGGEGDAEVVRAVVAEVDEPEDVPVVAETAA